jgi:hypothetical protein
VGNLSIPLTSKILFWISCFSTIYQFYAVILQFNNEIKINLLSYHQFNILGSSLNRTECWRVFVEEREVALHMLDGTLYTFLDLTKSSCEKCNYMQESTLWLRYSHRIKTHRTSTQPKKRNHCHTMIRHQNADTMLLPIALMRGISPMDVCHFEYYQGVNASYKHTGQDHGVSILMTNYS